MLHATGYICLALAISFANAGSFMLGALLGRARGYRDGRYDELLWWLRADGEEKEGLKRITREQELRERGWKRCGRYGEFVVWTWREQAARERERAE